MNCPKNIASLGEYVVRLVEHLEKRDVGTALRLAKAWLS
jgi:hypothetical protein